MVVSQMSPLRFPTSPRVYPLPLILSRFTSFCKSGIYSGDCSMMRLRSDRPVQIRGFGVSGSMSCDPLHEVSISIKQDRQLVCNQSVTVSDDMTGWSSVQCSSCSCCSSSGGAGGCSSCWYMKCRSVSNRTDSWSVISRLQCPMT